MQPRSSRRRPERPDGQILARTAARAAACFISLCLAGPWQVRCQSGESRQTANPARTAFEVASVKPAAQGPSAIDVSNGRVTMRRVPLIFVIAQAYDVPTLQVVVPDWEIPLRYDIFAKAPEALPADRIRAMLRALLAERFKLMLHHETREMEVVVMTVGKNGTKLRPSEDEGPSATQSEPRRSVVFKRTTMAELAARLSGAGPQTVDRTGLNGRFDFTLDYARYVSPDNPRIVSAVNDAQREAVEAQLGLKLTPKRIPLDLLIVDHAEKVPTEN